MKKTMFGMMVVFLLFAFTACDNNTTPEPAENNFNKKVFIGTTTDEQGSYLVSYLDFVAYTECYVYFRGEDAEIPVTYTVSDGVATLTGTGDYASLTLSTTRLTDDKFSVTYPKDIVQAEADMKVDYVLGDRSVFDEWTIEYQGNTLDTYIYGELEDVAKEFGLEENTDYTRDTTNKKIVLTEEGYNKVMTAMNQSSNQSSTTN